MYATIANVEELLGQVLMERTRDALVFSLLGVDVLPRPLGALSAYFQLTKITLHAYQAVCMLQI